MHDRAASTGKLWVLSVLGAVMIATVVALFVVGGAGHGPLRSSAKSSTEDRRASHSAAPVHRSTRAAGQAWTPRMMPDDDTAPANGTFDASSANGSVPAWVDGGPWGFDDLVAFWEKETVDPEWSANVKEYIYGMLDPDDLSLDVLNSVDCRQSLCRIEMNTAHMPAILRLSGMASGGSQLRLANKYVKPDGGPAVMVVYTAREDLAERVFPSQAPSPDAGSD
jgi:hypothetical protein